ncbi:hypothetical protein ACWD2L_06060 [Streptomyces sp. NPDC002754]
MISGKNADYGDTDDAMTLVPAALTCYRHFGLDATPGVNLTPMNRPHDAVYVDVPAGDTFVADCHAFRGYPGCGCAMCADTLAGKAHSSPSKGCKCGFYAHYNPDADFYESSTWGAPPTERFYGFTFGHTLPPGMAMVRAVVEMTGRVIVGTKGVRAEKMKVKALAVDWAKFSPKVVHMGADGEVALPAGYKFMIETRAKAAAAKYGAEYFDDPAAMYKAYPQPDLTALGIEPPQPPDFMPDGTPFWPAGTATWQAQAATQAAAVKQARSSWPTSRKPWAGPRLRRPRRKAVGDDGGTEAGDDAEVPGGAGGEAIAPGAARQRHRPATRTPPVSNAQVWFTLIASAVIIVGLIVAVIMAGCPCDCWRCRDGGC